MIEGEADRRRPHPVEAFEQIALCSAHGACLLWFAMVMADEVQQAMDHQQRQFIIEGAGMVYRLVARHLRADDDVTEQHRLIRGWCRINVMVIGGVERKREHIGWPDRIHELSVQRRHLIDIDETQRQLAAQAEMPRSIHRERTPTISIDCDRRLFIGYHHHAVRHGIASAATFIRRDDVGDDAVADHITSRQVHEGQLIDAGEHIFEAGETTATVGDIHLGPVAGHHDL